ncbi:MAG: hypothetical protein WAN61_01485 [Minisyncoccia bacterium]
MAELCRDRADAENGFNELKNRCGWSGFTIQDFEEEFVGLLRGCGIQYDERYVFG